MFIADCEDVGKPVSLRKLSHKKKRIRFHVRTDLSNSSIFLDLNVTTGPLGDTTIEQDDREDVIKSFMEEKGKHLWSMSGDFICRHHEAHRAKLYVPQKTTFPNPSKHVDVMRQTRRSIDNESEHTLKDFWNEEVRRCAL